MYDVITYHVNKKSERMYTVFHNRGGTVLQKEK